MMGSKGMKGGFEYDVFGQFGKKYLRFRSGTKAYVKRKFSKRMRKIARLEINGPIV